MERQAPRQIMYENQLPLAIESKSTRRLFFPEGGSEYGPTGGGQRPNIIRIPINTDSLLDVQHSYLQFKLTNLNGAGDNGIAPDFGVPFIRRLRIESAGTTLEDIEEYGKLYGGVLFPSQASVGAVQDASITTAGMGDRNAAVTIAAGGLSGAAATPLVAPTAAATGAIANTAAACGAFTTTAGGCAGGGTPSATQVDAAIEAALAGTLGNGAGEVRAVVDTAIATALTGTMTTVRGVVNTAINAVSADIKAKADTSVGTLVTNINGTVAGAGNVTGASALAGVKHPLGTTLGANGVVTYNVPLVSALMNMDKYLPLVMMNAGITLELELDVANSVGVSLSENRSGQAAAFVDADWKVSDVRYVAHLIDLQRDFYDKMRMVMEGSGGVLQLAGSTFRHYQSSVDAASQSDVINIPSRVKSIKSVFFTQQLNTQKASSSHFGVSESIPNNLSEYQFRIGSVVYPSTSVKLDGTAGGTYTNKGEAYSEYRKAFGTLGDYSEGGVMLNRDTYLEGAPSTKASGAYNSNSTPLVPVLCPMGLDFEAFPKTALESGVNTADRSLPMSLELKRHSAAGFACNVDVWLMCDAIFYVNLDGSVSVSI